MDGIDIFCGGCGDTATVTKVTAGLRHACGSTNIGVVGIDPMPGHYARGANEPLRDRVQISAASLQFSATDQSGTDPEPATRECEGCDGTGSYWGPLRPDKPYKDCDICQGTGRRPANARPGGYRSSLRVAAPHGPGTGWGKPMPNPAANWSDYVGPPATANPITAPPVSDNMTCPVCRGAGYDVSDKAICRECGGSGKLTATTSAPAVGQYDPHSGPLVGGARHASGSRRFFSEHPSGYRAEWHGGPRFHVYEGDTPVDSPTIKGYSSSLNSSDVEALTGKFTQKKLDSHLHGWVQQHGDEHSAFNHPDIERPSYGDRAKMRDLDAEGARRTAGRPSTADPYGTAEYQNAHGGGDYAGRGAPSGDFNPEDASSFYPKTDSQSPGARVREPRDYGQGSRYLHQLNEAPCPECGHAPTVLVKTQADRHGNQDAVWHCPSCGPLVNIDKNPMINPYRPHETGYAKPDRKALKTSRLAGLAEVTRSGKLLHIMATIQAHNAVSVGQSLTLARQTLLAYPEGRS